LIAIFIGIGWWRAKSIARAFLACWPSRCRAGNSSQASTSPRLTVVVNVWAMGAALFGVLAVLNWISPDNIRLSWEAPALDPHLLLVLVMISIELSLLTAVALFCSTFSSSALVSVVLTVGIFVAGLISTDLRHFTDLVVVSPVVGYIVSGIGWVLPAFSEFDIKSQVVHGVPVPAGFVMFTLAYGLMYVAALVSGAW
jgi:hypothetical protein